MPFQGKLILAHLTLLKPVSWQKGLNRIKLAFEDGFLRFFKFAQKRGLPRIGRSGYLGYPKSYWFFSFMKKTLKHKKMDKGRMNSQAQNKGTVQWTGKDFTGDLRKEFNFFVESSATLCNKVILAVLIIVKRGTHLNYLLKSPDCLYRRQNSTNEK